MHIRMRSEGIKFSVKRFNSKAKSWRIESTAVPIGFSFKCLGNLSTSILQRKVISSPWYFLLVLRRLSSNIIARSNYKEKNKRDIFKK